MRLPLNKKDDLKDINQEEVNRMVDLFIEKGFTYFDTGYEYHGGESEVALNKAVIARYPRDSFIIADKLPVYKIIKEEELVPIFEEQLERLGVEYFDYYLMHNVSGFSEPGFIGVNSFEFANKMKEEGKVKKLGLSSHANAEYLDNILIQHPEMEFVQLQLNYLDWESTSIEARKCYEVARKHNKPIIVMEPLKGGFLANVPEEAEKLMKDYNGQSPVEWALRFVAGLEGVILVLSGTSDYQQMEENIKIFDDIQPLNEEEHEILKKVIDIINSNITVNCTSCNYCLSSCNENINIPHIFDLYNSEMREDAKGYTVMGNAYANYSLEGNKIASDCIACGNCSNICPQHLDIPKYMKDVKARFEIPLYGFNK